MQQGAAAALHADDDCDGGIDIHELWPWPGHAVPQEIGRFSRGPASALDQSLLACPVSQAFLRGELPPACDNNTESSGPAPPLGTGALNSHPGLFVPGSTAEYPAQMEHPVKQPARTSQAVARTAGCAQPSSHGHGMMYHAPALSHDFRWHQEHGQVPMHQHAQYPAWGVQPWGTYGDPEAMFIGQPRFYGHPPVPGYIQVAPPQDPAAISGRICGAKGQGLAPAGAASPRKRGLDIAEVESPKVSPPARTEIDWKKAERRAQQLREAQARYRAKKRKLQESAREAASSHPPTP